MPVITDSSGKTEYAYEDFDFEFGRLTQVAGSCSVTYRGDFYVFGGYPFPLTRQISKVSDSKLKGCSLKRIGSLDFDFYSGGCAAVNEEAIYLCFDWDDRNRCHVGADPVGPFSNVTESQFAHVDTRIAANEGTNC